MESGRIANPPERKSMFFMTYSVDVIRQTHINRLYHIMSILKDICHVSPPFSKEGQGWFVNG